MDIAVEIYQKIVFFDGPPRSCPYGFLVRHEFFEHFVHGGIRYGFADRNLYTAFSFPVEGQYFALPVFSVLPGMIFASEHALGNEPHRGPAGRTPFRHPCPFRHPSVTAPFARVGIESFVPMVGTAGCAPFRRRDRAHPDVSASDAALLRGRAVPFLCAAFGTVFRFPAASGNPGMSA